MTKKGIINPITLLILMSIAMPVAFNTWSAMLNNFVVEKAAFTGVEKTKKEIVINASNLIINSLKCFLNFFTLFILSFLNFFSVVLPNLGFLHLHYNPNPD